jgi:uncharacterized membrane protein
MEKPHNMFAYIRKCFISGLLLWLPIWVTLLVIKFLVDLLSKSLLLLPPEYQPDVLLGYHIPGIGVIITLAILFFSGMIAANFIGSKFVQLGEKIMSRIPIVKTIYTGVKQVTETLFKPGGQSFRKVFLVQYPHSGMWTIAFQTGEAGKEIDTKLGSEPMITIFVPTTPNPTGGFLMVVPRNNAIELEMSVDQALKYVISLGVVQPSPHRPR